MKILNFNEFINIFENSNSKKSKITIDTSSNSSDSKEDKVTIYPEKDKKTGEKIIDKSQLSKEAIVNGLAKELYNAQYKAFTMQIEVDKIIDKMTKEDPNNPSITTFTASSALQVANAQLRADTIEQQMLAAAAASDKLTLKATEMAAEAKNLAMKAALAEFEKHMKELKNSKKKEDEK
jgi:hypothetical protein